MYIHTFIYVCAQIYAYMSMYIHAHKHTYLSTPLLHVATLCHRYISSLSSPCVYKNTYTHTNTHTHTHTLTHTSTHTRAHTHTRVRARARTHTHTHTHTCANTLTPSHTQPQFSKKKDGGSATDGVSRAAFNKICLEYFEEGMRKPARK